AVTPATSYATSCSRVGGEDGAGPSMGPPRGRSAIDDRVPVLTQPTVDRRLGLHAQAIGGACGIEGNVDLARASGSGREEERRDDRPIHLRIVDREVGPVDVVDDDAAGIGCQIAVRVDRADVPDLPRGAPPGGADAGILAAQVAAG